VNAGDLIEKKHRKKIAVPFFHLKTGVECNIRNSETGQIILKK